MDVGLGALDVVVQVVLFPLYPYDPTKEMHDSFFEACVWYKENEVVKKAVTEFTAAAEALLSKPA